MSFSEEKVLNVTESDKSVRLESELQTKLRIVGNYLKVNFYRYP